MKKHIFWEIRDGRNAWFWEDSWNQLPRLSDNPIWAPIQGWARVEGRYLVHHFWQDQLPNERRHLIFMNKPDQIEEEDWKAFQEEM